MKKIFFILPTLDCGGADRVTVTFAKGLNKAEFEPMIINIGKNEGELKESITGNLPLISLGKRNVSHSFFHLFELIKREKPDFLFSSRSHVSIIILLLGLFFKKLKIIIRVPNMPSNKIYASIKSKVVRYLEILLYKNAYKVISQTEEMKKEINEQYNINLEKIVTLTNPLDTELILSKLHNSINPFTVRNAINYVAVGNVCYRKGFDVLINAFKLLIIEHQNAHLYIIGRNESKYAQDLIMNVKKMQLEDNIHFLGFSSNPYVYMNYCDAFVLSSRMEGLPNVLLEAGYLNKPMVSTRCVPYVDKLVQNGVNGYTVEIENIEQMHLALKKVISIKFNNIENSDNYTNLEQIFN